MQLWADAIVIEALSAEIDRLEGELFYQGSTPLLRGYLRAKVMGHFIEAGMRAHAVEEKSSTPKVAPRQFRQARVPQPETNIYTNTFKATQKDHLTCLQYCLDEWKIL